MQIPGSSHFSWRSKLLPCWGMQHSMVRVHTRMFSRIRLLCIPSPHWADILWQPALLGTALGQTPFEVQISVIGTIVRHFNCNVTAPVPEALTIQLYCENRQEYMQELKSGFSSWVTSVVYLHCVFFFPTINLVISVGCFHFVVMQMRKWGQSDLLDVIHCLFAFV